MSAFYTVLVEGDDLTEPVADSVRALLDGHFVLARHKAEAGHFPAIDVLASISRMAEDLMSPVHAEIVRTVRAILAAQTEVADLVQVGAYQPGSDPAIDRAIKLAPKLTDCFLQNRTDHRSLSTTLSELQSILAVGYEA
jgi:flagellum-specific ATP synthase